MWKTGNVSAHRTTITTEEREWQRERDFGCEQFAARLCVALDSGKDGPLAPADQFASHETGSLFLLGTSRRRKQPAGRK